MAPLPVSRPAPSTSRLTPTARPAPAAATRPAPRNPLPSRPAALAVPALDAWRDPAADAKPSLLAQLVVAFFGASGPSRASLEDGIPAEYRSDEPQAHRSWVTSHIATRLATAGDDAFADH